MINSKRCLCVALTVIFSVVLLGCSPNQSEEISENENSGYSDSITDERDNDNDSSEVQDFDDNESIENDNNGIHYSSEIITRYDSDGVILNRVVQEFDENGNIVEELLYANVQDLYNMDEPYCRCEYEYDDVGNLMEESDYEADGTLICTNYEYEFDSNGNVINETRLTEGVCTYRYEYEYDEYGRLLRTATYRIIRGSWCLDGYSEYEVDESGVTIITNYTSDDAVSDREEIEYDSYGNEIIRFTYTPNGDLYRSWEYEYDDFGNLITITQYDSAGEIKTIEEYEYIYE